MILTVDEQTRDEQLRTETIRLNSLKDAVEHAMNVMYTARDESERDTEGQNTEWYNNLERLFSGVWDSIEGRMQELNPKYCEFQHSWMSDKAPLKQMMTYARQEGINFISLQGMSIEDTKQAIEFISSHGLASMNYEATCEAVKEYRGETLGLRKVR